MDNSISVSLVAYGEDMYAPHRLGFIGEQLAADHLVSKGYAIIDTNWRIPTGQRGELDLVTRKDGRLVFVEVKTSSRSTAMAIAHITSAKQRQLQALVRHWRHAHPEQRGSSRGDVIAIAFGEAFLDAPEIVHLEGVW